VRSSLWCVGVGFNEYVEFYLTHWDLHEVYDYFVVNNPGFDFVIMPEPYPPVRVLTCSEPPSIWFLQAVGGVFLGEITQTGLILG